MNHPLIDPETVSHFMGFDRKNLNWSYQPERRTIAELQAEGVAAVWNILSQGDVALLADEVGMGKTMQALGVVALQWLRKPKARILIVAPNQSVAENWESEINAFLRQHWRRPDNLVQSEVDLGPVHTPTMCRTLQEVVDAFSVGAARLVITKLTIFSHLTSGAGDGTARAKRTEAQDEARRLRQVLLDAVVEPIDLLVLDEAHGLRTVDGGSQKVAAVRAFLGDPADLLARKSLLLTATPNHSSNRDVQNLLSYFVGTGSIPASSSDCLADFAVRRLRLLESRNKYHYREEIAYGCDFREDPAAEMFFTLYQKQLAELETEDGVPVFRNEKRGFLYGYLEGFETVNPSVAEILADDQERNDYRRAEDSDLLRVLSEGYRDCMGETPNHPKYDRTTDRLVPEQSSYWNRDGKLPEEDKSLVFVRRIPSCRELAARVNEKYDRLLLGRLMDALEEPNDRITELLRAPSLRDPLDTLIKGKAGVVDLDGPEDDKNLTSSSSDGFRPSLVMDWFRKGKPDDVPYTQGFLFRGRFQKVKELYPLFFEPPFSASNPDLPTPPAALADCRNWIQSIRLRNMPSEQSLLLRGHWKVSRAGGIAPDVGSGRLRTLASIFQKTLRAQDKEAWESFLRDSSNAVQEAFFQTYLRKGLLLASGAVVELYCWFLKAQRSSGKGAMYDRFCDQVERGMDGSLTQALIGQAVSTFREVVEKFASKYDDKGILGYAWNELNGHDPAAFCSGEVADRSRLITAFNTPFYPNVLVATSVLQEGVNLHQHCRRVLHYGIAWTPGDNEQRVGRVDRLGGCVHRNIVREQDDRLLIEYPFLSGTFDEDQVGQFVVRKHAAEKILDRGEAIRVDKAIDASRNESQWQSHLRKPISPDQVLDLADPYPYRHQGSSCDWLRIREDLPSLQDFGESLLRQAVPGLPFPTALHGTNQRCTWYLEPQLDGDRKSQPVEVRIVGHEPLALLHEHPVFVLQMSTPLFETLPIGLEGFLPELGMRFPLVQVCSNPKVGGHWHVHLRSCLPILLRRETLSDCSPSEVVLCLRQLVEAGEWLESQILPDQDLTLASIGQDLAPLRVADQQAIHTERKVVALHPDWSVLGDVASRNVAGPLGDLAADLQVQADHPFLFRCFDDIGSWEVRFPAIDVQQGELQLLDRWVGTLDLRHGPSFLDPEE